MAQMQATGGPVAPLPVAGSRFLGRPQSREGRLSFLLLLIFTGVMAFFFFFEIPLLDVARDMGHAFKLGMYVIMFSTLGVAVVLTAGAGILAGFSVVRRHERSLLLALPLLIGVVIPLFVIASLGAEQPEPRRNSHSNVSAIAVSPTEVRVAFDFSYRSDPAGAKITWIAVQPIGLSGQPLDGYADSGIPVTSFGSGHVDVVIGIPESRLPEVTGFLICFTGPGVPPGGCTTVVYSDK